MINPKRWPNRWLSAISDESPTNYQKNWLFDIRLLVIIAETLAIIEAIRSTMHTGTSESGKRLLSDM